MPSEPLAILPFALSGRARSSPDDPMGSRWLLPRWGHRAGRGVRRYARDRGGQPGVLLERASPVVW